MSKKLSDQEKQERAEIRRVSEAVIKWTLKQPPMSYPHDPLRVKRHEMEDYIKRHGWHEGIHLPSREWLTKAPGWELRAYHRVVERNTHYVIFGRRKSDESDYWWHMFGPMPWNEISPCLALIHDPKDEYYGVRQNNPELAERCGIDE